MMPLGLLAAVKTPGYVHRPAPSIRGTTLPHQIQGYSSATPFQSLHFPETLPEFDSQI